MAGDEDGRDTGRAFGDDERSGSVGDAFGAGRPPGDASEAFGAREPTATSGPPGTTPRWLPPTPPPGDVERPSAAGPPGHDPRPWAQPSAPDRDPFVAAGWWKRVGASLLDGVIVGFTVAFVLGLAGADVEQAQLVTALIFLAYAVLMLTYHDGMTLGKQALRIRVVTLAGEPVGLGRAFGRELVKAVFAITGILYVIDVLWPLGQSQKRALHDLIAGTRVVVTRDRA